jgi:hypothetical protein
MQSECGCSATVLNRKFGISFPSGWAWLTVDAG